MVASLHAAPSGNASGPLRMVCGMHGHMHFRCAQSEKTDMSKGKGKGQLGFGPLSESMDKLERAVDKISGKLSAKIVKPPAGTDCPTDARGTSVYSPAISGRLPHAGSRLLCQAKPSYASKPVRLVVGAQRAP